MFSVALVALFNSVSDTKFNVCASSDPEVVAKLRAQAKQSKTKNKENHHEQK